MSNRTGIIEYQSQSCNPHCLLTFGRVVALYQLKTINNSLNHGVSMDCACWALYKQSTATTWLHTKLSYNKMNNDFTHLT